MLPAVFRVADELLALRIDNEVEQLQGHLADDDGKFVRNLGDIAQAIAPLHRQPNGGAPGA